jgi:hypothetical protein
VHEAKDAGRRVRALRIEDAIERPVIHRGILSG